MLRDPDEGHSPRMSPSVFLLASAPGCLPYLLASVACGFASCAVSRRYPHGHRCVFGSNRCEPYRVHFLNCLGLPPNCPFSRAAACLAFVLAKPPTRPPRRPSSAAAFDSVDSCMLFDNPKRCGLSTEAKSQCLQQIVPFLHSVIT